MARTKYCGGDNRVKKSLQTWEGWDSSDNKDNKSQDDDLQDNDSQSVVEITFGYMPMGMIEFLPLWDQISGFLKGATCSYKRMF
jgi:hypothetical protein